MERRMNVPVRVGDELDVKIEAVGEKGDGIAKVGGFVLFVPNTKEGDTVKIRVTRVLRRVGFAEVVGEAKSSKKKFEEPEEESEEPEEEPEEEYEEPEEESEEPEDSEDFGEELEEEKER